MIARKSFSISSLLIIATAAALVPGQPARAQSGAKNGEWPSYAGDKGSTKYSPLDQINKSNVSQLKIAWHRPTVDPKMIEENPRTRAGSVQNTPLMKDGMLFISDALGRVEALSAITGETIWVDKLTRPSRGGSAEGAPERPDADFGAGGATRSVAYWADGADGRVIAVSGEYLIAYNAKTGAAYPNFGENGFVDLRVGMSRPVNRYSGRSGPIVANDVIVVGSFIGDINALGRNTPKTTPPGDVRGYDVRTGKQLWLFKTIPGPGEFGYDTWEDGSADYTGSANAWSLLTADEELGYVYLPLTTPSNDWYGGHRHGNGLFAESLVCIEAKTGKRVWHFQAVHHGVWDYDFPCAPILCDITVDGKKIKAVAQLSKQAFCYVFDRKTGEPVWPIVEEPVSQSNVPGEKLSSTQPIPSKPPGYDQQGVTIDDLIDFTPQLRAEAVEMVKDYVIGPVFTAPMLSGDNGKKGSMHMPGTWGGTNWNGGGFDPETGILYAPSIKAGMVAQIVKSAEGSEGSYVRRARQPIAGPQGLPLFKPPYGRIVAIDLNKGDIKWTTANAIGPRDNPLIKDLPNVPARLGTPARAGFVITKTLLFSGEGGTQDGPGAANSDGKTRFWAYDKATGEPVWNMEFPPTSGVPMTYMAGGKQYIVVATGRPAEYVALSLP